MESYMYFIKIIIVLFCISIISILFIMFSIWVLENKKGTNLYKWINKYVITDKDLDV